MAKYDLQDIKVAAGRKHDHDPPIIKRRRRNGNHKAMVFASTHHHSTFSYDDGFQLPEAHIRRAEELQMGTVFFTEHGNVSSHVKAEKAGEKSGVKVQFGCELYTGKVGDGANRKKYHLTVLAATDEGYTNLVKLVTASWREGFYSEPTVSWQMLKRYKRGLIVLSGCSGSLLFCSAVGGKLIPDDEASESRAIEVARRFRRVFGDSYYIEVQAFPRLEKTCRFNKMAPRIAAAVGAKLVATKDVHYTELEEAEVQKILHASRPGEKRTVEQMEQSWGYDLADLSPPVNDRTIYQDLMATGLTKGQAIEAIASTAEIAERCSVTLPKLDMVRFPLPRGYKSIQDYLWSKLREGWRYRDFNKLPRSVQRAHVEQVKREMSILLEKDYGDYFAIVGDLVTFAKDYRGPEFPNGVPVGPGRGSAAASDVCYLLRITEVNPLLYPNLLFERFIDITREDLPDIDLDFPGESRSIIRDYAVSRYGRECVNNLGTRTMYKAKNALDTVGRVFNIPQHKVNAVKDMLIERSSGDLRASATIEDTLANFDRAREVAEEYPDIHRATELEGQAKGEGVHAAGLIISNGPISDVCSFIVREVPKGSGNWVEVVTHDKYDAERQGLLKIDLLGLNTMSMLDYCCREVGMTPDDLYKLPLDDERTINGFHENDVVGVFQFDGRATRYVCGAVRPNAFAEVCDVGALSRPGPLHNGAAREYAEIKHSGKAGDLLHPSLGPITEATKGQIIYQEQVLRICREVGHFDWTHAAHIRTIISRKYGEAAFNKEWGRFLRGAKTLHRRSDWPKMTEAVAKAIWGDMITSGSYAFNAAHTVSYGLISYWTMWFKMHHSAVFYAAALDRLAEEKQHDLLRDAVRGNEATGRPPITVKPPSPRRSGESWRPSGRRSVRAGFKQVEGIGKKTAPLIERYRAENGLRSWSDLINIKGIGDKTIIKIREFAEAEDPFDIYAIDRNVAAVRAELEALGLPNPTHRAIDLPYEQKRDVPVTWLGTIRARNVRDIFEQNRAKTGEALDESEVRDPHLSEFILMTGEDETDQLLVKLDRWRYPRYRQGLWNMKLGHDLVLVQGVKPFYATARQIKVNRLWIIEP